MVKHSMKDMELNKSDEATCTYFSIFGVLIALTCLVQLFIYSNFALLSIAIMGFYIFNLASFILLGLQKRFATLFIFISTFLSFCIFAVYSATLVFSLALILLTVYNSIVTIVILMEDLPKKIKNKCNMERLEDEYWKEKL